MDFNALSLSLRLALLTAVILIPLGVFLAHFLHRSMHWSKSVIETICLLPLVLPPTVLGFYMLIFFGNQSLLGRLLVELTGQSGVFSFQGILLASLLFNLPFAILPIQRAFESIPDELRDAAATCGLSSWQMLRKVELPLASRGILSATILTVAHTLGEFGVVLMVGGNIPDQTRTLSIAIYDKVQALDLEGAGVMSLTLLVFSFVALWITQGLGQASWFRKGTP